MNEIDEKVDRLARLAAARGRRRQPAGQRPRRAVRRRQQHRNAAAARRGTRCSCGSNGCWEAYVSNRATLARYFGHEPEVLGAPDPPDFTIDDLLARARGGDRKARAALRATGKFLGVGLALLVNGLDPSAVYVGGEITGAWDIIEPPMRAAFLERALTPAVAATVILPVATLEYPRLRGAAALVTAPAFAAPIVA